MTAHAPDTQAASPAVDLIAPVDDDLVDSFASTFKWSSLPGARSYRLQVARDEEFSALTVDVDTGTSTELTLYDLMLQGRMYWRIQAQTGDAWVASRSEPFRAAIDYTERASSVRAAGQPGGSQAGGSQAGSPQPGSAVAPAMAHRAPYYGDEAGAMSLVWIWVALTVAAAALIILKLLFSAA